MTRYVVRPGSGAWDGVTIGILILDASYPRIPGNVGNATSFGFPVRYELVPGATISRLIEDRDPTLRDEFIAAARRLEAAGVEAITGACGFMAIFQPEVAAAVQVPVFLSSLQQLPFIYSLTGAPTGVITANARQLSPDHFAQAGVGPEVPRFVRGLEAQPEFRSSVLEESGALDDELVELEVTAVARELCATHPEIRAILLECSDLPPFAGAVQLAVGRPVFDYVTMIEYVQRALRPPRYEGYL